MTGKSTHFEAIVIGVGGMGSAAVYHLAKRGVDVLGIERFDIPHTRGSSHGDTRIFRLTQPEHPDYFPLAKRAQDLWRDLEAESGAEILVETGSIHAGPPDGSKVSDAAKSCEVNDLEHEVLTATEINGRFPGYELPESYRGVYQPDGGFLACERAVTTHVKLAQSHGGTVRARERVLHWKPDGSQVQVRTNRNRYTADHLVVAAGAWAGKHLEFLSDQLVPQRRVMAWLQPEAPKVFTPEHFPVFSVDVPEGSFYGFPEYERPGFKFGRTPDLPEVIDPDGWRDEPTLQDEEVLRMLPENHFPAGAGPTMAMTSCIVTRSTDGHFYLDTHPDYPQVSIAAGFTGHGFKFSSAIGDTLADFVAEGETDNRIDPFRFDGRLE